MRTMRNQLTAVQIKRLIDAAKADPNHVKTQKSDGAGLTLVIRGGGKHVSVSWVLRYGMQGRKSVLVLGTYPAITLAEARRIMAEKRALIARGVDVAREKQIVKRQARGDVTVRQLAADYAKKVFPTLAKNTVDQRQRYLNKRIVPRIGMLTVREVEAADIVGILERCPSRPTAGNVLTTARSLFQHAMGKKLIAADPTAGISVAAVIGAHEKRDRLMLTDDELTVLLRALPQLDERYEHAIMLLLLTAVRIGELLSARWEHIDLDAALWTIPATNTKTRQGFVIPLPGLALHAFRRLEILACGSEYVLPAMRQSRSRQYSPHMIATTLTAAIKRLCHDLAGQVRPFTAHDLRSTARSHLAELGVSVVVAERCLNHKLGGLVSTYDRHDYLDERRRALDLWAAKIASLELDGNGKKVVPIKA